MKLKSTARRLVHLVGLLILPICACQTIPEAPDYGRPLPLGAPALLPLTIDEHHPELRETWVQREELLMPIERSIGWTRLDYARQFFPIAGISHGRALRSLERFHELLATSTGPDEFERAVEREFQWFKSAGWNGQGGGVLYTGYCTPILPGSLTADREFSYPLYALPDDLEKGPNGEILGQRTTAGLRPYPTRRAIEAGGLLDSRSLELIWLRDPLDAFIAHVNGSAFIELQDGSMARFGYSGKNGQAYVSLGGELVKDGHISKEDISLSTIRSWARRNPDLVQEYLMRNHSYVFFTPIEGNPRGSLNVEVEARRSLATDKALFPRGALTFIETDLPMAHGGSMRFHQMMLDQDTGGAIRTAGRADIYLGIGPEAEQMAGATKATGQLYYLFLR